jgi:protein SCO1/2
MNRRQSIALISFAIVAVVIGALLAQRVLVSRVTQPLVLASGTLLQPARELPVFSLVDQDNQPFDVGRLRGQWSFLFFGFANCGDICPVTLALLASANKSLADLPARNQAQLVFVSVDPRRDTPAALKSYVGNFDPKMLGVTGEQSNVDAFTKSLGVPSGTRLLENGNYAVDHSGAVLAINPQGQFAALFSPPLRVDLLAADMRQLIGSMQP